MIRKIFSFFVVYLLIGSLIDIGVKSQEAEIDWNDEKQAETALKNDPISSIQQNPERAKEFLREHPSLTLENENIGNAYFDSLIVITDSRDKELAGQFLSKKAGKNFDLSKGELQIEDGGVIIDEKGKRFSIEQIKAMGDVVA